MHCHYVTLLREHSGYFLFAVAGYGNDHHGAVLIYGHQPCLLEACNSLDQRTGISGCNAVTHRKSRIVSAAQLNGHCPGCIDQLRRSHDTVCSDSLLTGSLFYMIHIDIDPFQCTVKGFHTLRCSRKLLHPTEIFCRCLCFFIYKTPVLSLL